MNLLADAFIRHALLAGIPIAAAAGLAGYFLVLRSQVFSGDALSHVAFTGALGALAVGVDPVAGLFVSTVLTGGLLALLGGRGRAGDVVIGTTFAWILGLGVLALSVYSSSARASANGAAGVRVLFGSIFGLDRSHALVAAAISLAVVAVLLGVGRPLLFASLDPQVAAARGLPVGLLGGLFLATVGAAAGVATQAIGALLIVGLLAAPAGAAGHLTASPYAAMAWSTGLAVLAMTAGIIASDVLPKVPPSFAILSVAVLCYLAAYLCGRVRRRKGPAPVGTGPFRTGLPQERRQPLASLVKNDGPAGEPTPVSLS
jgi:zinc/manganese transport system permease protein